MTGDASVSSFPRRRGWQVVAFLGFLVLVAVTAGIWIRVLASFPALPQGDYFLQVFVEQDETPEAPRTWLVRQGDEHVELILLGDYGLDAVQFFTRPPGGFERAEPLLLISAGRGLELYGRRTPEGTIVGTVRSSARHEGRWRLYPATSRQRESEAANREVLLYLALTEELRELDGERDAKRRVVERQQSDLDMLLSVVTEEGALRARSDIRRQEVDQQLSERRKVVAGLRGDVQQLREKLSVALRVVPAGRLVTLSREGIHRQLRYQELLLRGELPPPAPEYRDALLHADRVDALRSRIEELEQLLATQAPGGTAAGTSLLDPAL